MGLSRSLFILRNCAIFQFLVLAVPASAQGIVSGSDGGSFRVGFEIASQSATICFLHEGVCLEAERINPYVYTIPQYNGEEYSGSFVAMLDTDSGTQVRMMGSDTSGEWSRGVYVIIGALIGLVSTFGVRLVEIGAASIFRRRRAVARLRANLLRIQENLVTAQPVAFSDVVLNLTSYGQVLLREHILNIQGIIAKHQVSSLTTAEAKTELDTVDASLGS